MNVSISWPSSAQWTAAGRHAISYSAGAATAAAGILAFGATMHIITPDQSQAITGALSNISTGVKAVVDGLTTIVGGVATLCSVGAGAYAMYASSHKAQAASVAAVPGTTIVTDPKLAAAVPAANVVSNADHTVKPTSGL